MIAFNRKPTRDVAHPAANLWQVSQRQPHCDPFLVNCAAPSPLERFGMLIILLRRQQRLERLDLAQRSGFELDEMAALELGAATLDEVVHCLPSLTRALALPPCFLTRLFCDVVFNADSAGSGNNL